MDRPPSAERAPDGLGLRAWRSLSASLSQISASLSQVVLVSDEQDAWQVLYDLSTQEVAIGGAPSPTLLRTVAG